MLQVTQTNTRRTKWHIQKYNSREASQTCSSPSSCKKKARGMWWRKREKKREMKGKWWKKKSVKETQRACYDQGRIAQSIHRADFLYSAYAKAINLKYSNCYITWREGKHNNEAKGGLKVKNRDVYCRGHSIITKATAGHCACLRYHI